MLSIAPLLDGTNSETLFNGQLVGATSIDVVKDLRAGEFHRYNIVDVRRPARVTIQATADELDAALALYAEDTRAQGRVLTSAVTSHLLVNSNDRSVGDKDPSIVYHLAPGSYFFDVSAAPFAAEHAASGTYELNFDIEPAESPFSTISLTNGGWSLAIAAGDFDGDDDLDLATANFQSNDVSILLNLNDGTYAPSTEYVVGRNPQSIVTGDFNGDDQLDLAVENDTDGTVAFLAGRGDGTFKPPYIVGRTSPDTFKETGKIAAGDMNNDGVTDLVVPDRDGKIYVFTGTLDGRFAESLVILESISSKVTPNAEFALSSAAVGDVNNDGWLDIVVSIDSTEEVGIWLNDQTGGFTRKNNVWLGNEGVESIEIVILDDFDGDERLDLAAADDKVDIVSVRLGNGDGSFHDTGGRYAVGKDSEFVLAGDFDDDGYPDLATGNEDSRDITILKNLRDGTFHVESNVPVYAVVDEMVAGDFNGDNKLDLAAVSRDNGVTILKGLGDYAFQRDERLRVGDDPQAIVHGDWNGDALTDLAVVNGGTDDVSILLGRGDGNFEPEMRFAVGSKPKAIASADFNLDGRLDLATANSYSDDVSILLGVGNGRFVRVGTETLVGDGAIETRDIAVGDSPFSIVAGDFDRDGIQDLATANRKSNDVSILYGSGHTDLFELPITVDVGRFPVRLVMEDFNDDALPDLGTVNRLSHDVSLLINANDRLFIAERYSQTLPSEPAAAHMMSIASEVDGWRTDDQASRDRNNLRFFPRDLGVADFNGDGFLDIAVSDDQNDAISIFLNRSDGSYEPAITFPSVGDPEQLVVADLDSDGIPDLITANDRENSVSIHWGRGDGTFGGRGDGTFEGIDTFDNEHVLQEKVGVPGLPESVAVGDYNSDGRMDLAVTGKKDHELAIFLQGADRCFTSCSGDDETVAAKTIAQADMDTGGINSLIEANKRADSLSVLWESRSQTIGQESTVPRSGDEVLASPQEVVVDRFDSDGPLDQPVKGNEDSVVFVRDRARSFCEDSTCPDGGFNQGMIAADLDGDGHLDLATPNFRDQVGTIEVYLGNGKGAFPDSPVTVTPTPGAHIRSMKAADMDLDGVMDLVAADLKLNRIWILWGYGEGDFEATPIEVGPGSAASLLDFSIRPVVVEDVNGDGFLDVATVDQVLNQISVLLGVGNRSFRVHQLPSGGDGSGALVAADVDGDGRVEMIVGNRDSHDISIVKFVDGPLPDHRVNRIASKQKPPAIVQVDLNRDDRLDHVIIDDISNELSVELDDGRGGFTASQQVTPGFRSIHVEDIDGDGAAEVMQVNRKGRLIINSGILANSESDDLELRDVATVKTNRGDFLAASMMTEGRIELFPIDGSPRPDPIMTGRFPTRLASADLNQDGQDDLVVIESGDQRVAIYIAGTEGAFSLEPSHVIAGDVPVSVALVDVSRNDDKPDNGIDIVIANQQSGDVLVYWNDGLGNFDSDPLRVRASNGVYGVCGDADDRSAVCSHARTSSMDSGDFNHDNVLDLVLTNPGVNALSILFGTKSGGFVDPYSVTGDTLVGPTDVRAADLNGDQHLDLVILNQGNGTVSPFLGNGQGGFQETYTSKVDDAANQLAIETSNEGRVHHLLVSTPDGDLQRLKGNGDGTFTAPPSTNKDFAFYVEGDNEDGIPRLVHFSLREESMSTEPAGNGRRSTLETGISADLNLDGVQDTVVPHASANQVLIYFGETADTGQVNTFQSEYSAVFVGTNPEHVAIGDLNGDNIPDMVVANRGSNDLSVLLGHMDEVDGTAFRSDTWKLVHGQRLRVEGGANPVFVTLADITDRETIGKADGVLDILVTNQGSNDVHLLPGLGHGFFDDQPANTTIYNAGIDPMQTLVMDDQLLIVNSGSSDITQFAGFDPRQSQAPIKTGGSRPVAVVARDVDRDDNLDLLIAHSGDGSVWLLLRGESDLVRLRQPLHNLRGPVFALFVRENGSRLEFFVISGPEFDAQPFGLDLEAASDTRFAAASIDGLFFDPQAHFRDRLQTMITLFADARPAVSVTSSIPESVRLPFLRMIEQRQLHGFGFPFNLKFENELAPETGPSWIFPDNAPLMLLPPQSFGNAPSLELPSDLHVPQLRKGADLPALDLHEMRRQIHRTQSRPNEAVAYDIRAWIGQNAPGLGESMTKLAASIRQFKEAEYVKWILTLGIGLPSGDGHDGAPSGGVHAIPDAHRKARPQSSPILNREAVDPVEVSDKRISSADSAALYTIELGLVSLAWHVASTKQGTCQPFISFPAPPKVCRFRANRTDTYPRGGVNQRDIWALRRHGNS